MTDTNALPSAHSTPFSRHLYTLFTPFFRLFFPPSLLPPSRSPSLLKPSSRPPFLPSRPLLLAASLHARLPSLFLLLHALSPSLHASLRPSLVRTNEKPHKSRACGWPAALPAPHRLDTRSPGTTGRSTGRRLSFPSSHSAPRASGSSRRAIPGTPGTCLLRIYTRVIALLFSDFCLGWSLESTKESLRRRPLRGGL